MNKKILTILIIAAILSISAYATGPTVNNIPDQIINPDKTFNTISLDDYLEDADPENITWTYSGNSDLTVEINDTTHIATITAPDDWTGQETITFTATDDEMNSEEDDMLARINNPPTLSDISDLSFDEDKTNLEANLSIDLDDYVSDDDVNDTITWSTNGNTHISVTIDPDTHIVTLTPETDWNGEETITFTASDGYAEDSDNFTVTINPVNDAPKYEQIQTQHLSEDQTHTLDLKEWFKDVDGDELEFSIVEEPSHISIELDDDGVVTFTPDQNWIGEEEATFSASDPDEESIEGDILLIVGPDVCRGGIIGDFLRVDIEEPDNGDEFAPGEIMNIEVEVDNDHKSRDFDVKVEAILYNIDEDEKVRSVRSETKEVKDGRHRSFELELEVPNSVDDDDLHYLYVKAYEVGDERENCDYERVEIDFDRESHDVIIKKVSVSPSTELNCGDAFSVIVDVKNLGLNEEDDVYVVLKNPQLGINKYSNTFELDEYDESGNDRAETFQLSLPKDAEGDYWIYTAVYFNNGADFQEQTTKLNVDCGEKEEDGLGEITGSAVLQPVEESISVKPGRKTFTIPLIIQNNGEEAITPILNISGIDLWAEVINIEQPQTLKPGSQAHTYIYMVLKEGVVAGAHDLTVEVTSDSQILESAMLTVNIEEDVTKNLDDVVASKGGFLNKKTFWIVGDIILILFAILLIRALFRR